MLVQLLRWDLALQLRHGFWVAAVFALLPWLAVLLSISQEQASFVLPAVIFIDISITGTLFMAGVYFFEKREGSIYALAVTPLRAWQWLTSKLVTLTVIGTVMCIALAAVGNGRDASWGTLVVACLGLNALFVLLGFLVAAPNERFTGFFVNWVPLFALIQVPCLSFFDVEHPLYWLLPTQPALVLLRGAFDGMPPAHFAAALGLLLGWIGLTYLVSARTFQRNVADRRSA